METEHLTEESQRLADEYQSLKDKQKAAAVAAQAGMSQAAILGIASGMSSLGLEAEAGGSAVSKTINAINLAVETGSDDMAAYASVAKMSAAEFAAAWKGDAESAFAAFVEGIGSSGSSAIVTLAELGIEEVRQIDALSRAAGAGDLFRTSIDRATESWRQNTALTEEAAKRYATTESQIAMLQNAYGNLQIAIGDVFTPTLKELAELGNDVLGDLTEFVEANPVVVKVIAALTLGVAAFAGGLAAYTVATKLVWYGEPLSGEKKRGVKLICTACKQSVITEKVENDCCHPAYSMAAYGFIHPETKEVHKGCECCLCPECGSPVTQCTSEALTTYNTTPAIR